MILCSCSGGFRGVATAPPPMDYSLTPFCIRNKAQIARESTTPTPTPPQRPELPGPFSGSWTPAVIRDFRLRARDYACRAQYHNLLRPPPPHEYSGSAPELRMQWRIQGAQQAPRLKLDQLRFFNQIFLSECLKIRLRLHERALK